MIYLLIAIITCIISGRLFKIRCGTISIFRPNMMSVIFYYYLILQCVIGAVLIVNGWEKNNWELDAIINNRVRIYGFWAIMYTMIAFPFGMMLANAFLRKSNISNLFSSYCKKPIQIEEKSESKMVKYLLVSLSAISLLCVLYVIRTIGEIGILKVFSTDSAAELAGFRIDSGRGFTGNAFIRGFFAMFLCPLLCYISYGYKLIRNSSFNKFWFYALFVGSILILTSNLEKAPLMMFLIGFLFFRIYRGNYFTKKQLGLIFCVAAVMISLIYVAVMKTETDQLAVGILNRLTISSVGGLYLDFDIFPDRHPFLGFSSFSKEINTFFCEPHNERSARIAMMFAQPEAVASGQAGVINCLFVGEAWANWGWQGLILSPIYVGFIIQLFYLGLLSLRKTPLLLGIMVKYTFASSITGGVNDYLYNTAVRWVVLMTIIILLLSQLYKFNKKNESRYRISGNT